MNQTILYGRITADAAVKYTQSNKATCRFTLAVNRIGEGADFIRCVAWEKVAENMGKYVRKGDRLLINGSITTGSYKDKDGKTVYTTDVTARAVQFIEMKKKDGGFKETEEPLPDVFEDMGLQSNLDDMLPF